MKNKCTACLTFFLVGLLLFSSCQSKSNIENQSEDIVKLELLFVKNSGNIDDAELVIEKINEYIEPKIGVNINISFVGENYSQAANQKLSSNEQVDIIYCPYYSLLEEWKELEWLYPLDSLLDSYGNGVLQAISEDYIYNGEIDGSIYGLPTNRDMASNLGLEYRKDIADKYDIDMSNINSFDDLSLVFQEVKEKCPDITPLASVRVNKTWDNLGDNFGVLMNFGNNTDVVNLYETSEFENMTRLAYEWHQKGYVLDTISDSGDNFYYFGSGEVFSSFANGKPGFETQETRIIGEEIGFVEIYPAFTCTSNISGYLYAIPTNSANPEKAMGFLNLMYSDPVVVNLLIYGIEGTHYEFSDKESEIITFPEGVDVNNSGYAQFDGWRKGNQFISYIWKGDSTDIWEQIEVFNKNALKSKAYGFRFDDTNVQNEIIKCNKIRDEYLPGFENGVLNPDEVLPEFQRALRDAGIDDIINEKQNQLNNWLQTGEDY